MTANQPTGECYDLARLLTDAIEANDLEAMERGVAALRRSLERAAASDWFEAERLEALEALTEGVVRSLAALRSTVAEELDRIRHSGRLLAALAGPGLSATPTC